MTCSIFIYPPRTVLCLQEVKQLTLDLLDLAPESHKRKEKDRSVVALEWKSGELCKAVWTDTGK